MKKRPYSSLQDWLERTGTSPEELCRRTGIGRSHMSRIMMKSRRCSLENVVKLSVATGQPVDVVLGWLVRRSDSQATSPVSAQI